MNSHRLRWLAVAAALAACLVVVTGAALGDGNVQHGISVTKGCTSPVTIGSAYACTYTVRNNIDDAHDTLTFNSFVDSVHAAGGDVTSANIFANLNYVIGTFEIGFSTPPSCTGGVGTGTALDPFRSAPGNPLTLCTLPFGSRLNTQSNSFYTVQAADFALPSHRLADDVTLGWRDTCDDTAQTGNTNCSANPQTNGAASSALIVDANIQITPATATNAVNTNHVLTITANAVGGVTIDPVRTPLPPPS